jgi:hypothetical protein
MDPISNDRDRALLRASDSRPTWDRAVECYLIISPLPGTKPAIIRGGGRFKIVIDVGSSDHLREVDRHAVEQFTGL